MNFDHFCVHRGISEATFADVAGLSIQTLNAWRADKKAPALPELRETATSFGVSLAALVEDTPLEYLPQGVPPIGLALQPDNLTPTESLQRWIADRHLHWGYLGLHLPREAAMRVFPVSAGQAASFVHDMMAAGPHTIVVGATSNNRIIAFNPGKLRNATVVRQTKAEMADLFPAWDDQGLPPEIYRSLEHWASKKIARLTETTTSMAQRVEAVLAKPGMRDHDKVLQLTSNTLVHYLDGRSLELRVDRGNLRTALGAIPLGAGAFYLEQHHGTEEHLIALDDVALLDMPTSEVEAYPNAFGLLP